MQSKHWLQLIEENQSDVFHSPKWLEVLAKTYDFTVRAKILIDAENQPVAGIPFIKIDDMFSPRIVSVPFSDYCDPIVQNREQWVKLTTSLISEKQPLTVRCLHNSIPLADDRFERINRANWHGRDITDDLDSIFSKIHGSSRRAIRKAEKAGITVRTAEHETDLRAFFELHLKIRKDKYRLLAQSYKFLQNIWKNFIEPGEGALMLAESDGQIIGGVFYLKWKNNLYYKFNASAPEAQNIRPNDLLMWEGIKYAKKNSATFLDLGLSDWGQEGLIRYKQKYATEEKVISFLRHTPEGSVSEKDAQIRSLLPQLTDLFTDESVPDEITEKAGDLLYKFFT
ncbi:MAG: GNAT family N-acetyltransferase [Calditrichaeota bacterium]|nr:MAG: GNAT family N-acetyltransferase [Calditrichota bacterium]